MAASPSRPAPRARLCCGPGLRYRWRRWRRGRCAFVETVLAGGDLTAAHAAAAALDEGFDVMTAFTDLLAAGAFAGVAGNRGEGDRA